MSMEADLFLVLEAVCPRAFPDVAPLGTVPPYITYQAIGGRALRNLDNSAADKRHTRLQINVYSATRLESITLIRQIEDAMCASPAFTAAPDAEPLHNYDSDMLTYEAIQDFSVYSAR